MYIPKKKVVVKMDEREITTKPPEEPRRYGSIQSSILGSGTADSEDYAVYPSRFYVLAVFSLLSVVQSMAWLTFGTIPNESKEYFGLTDDDVTIIAG